MIYFLRLMFLLVFTVAVVEASLDVNAGRGLAIFCAVVSGILIIGTDEVYKELS